MDSAALVARVAQLEAQVAQLMAKQTPTTPPTSPKAYTKPKDDGKVSIALYKKGVLVTGSTFAIKDALKENGGRWNRILTGWIFTTATLDNLIDAIRQNKEVELTLGEGVQALTTAKETNEVIELD